MRGGGLLPPGLLLLGLPLLLAADAAAPPRDAPLSFVVHREESPAAATAPADTLIETRTPTFFTVRRHPEADPGAARADAAGAKYVWTIEGEPHVGVVVGPVVFDSCADGGGVSVELVELRAVEGTSWFDSRDVTERLRCVTSSRRAWEF